MIAKTAKPILFLMLQLAAAFYAAINNSLFAFINSSGLNQLATILMEAGVVKALSIILSLPEALSTYVPCP